MIKNIISFIAGVIFCLIVSSLFYIYWSTHKMTEIHTLKYPILLSGDNSNNLFHILPKGTTLYFDKTFDEGFDRYKVYINIKEPLELSTLDDPTKVRPIWGYTADKATLKSLLQDYPLTKNDLQSILKSGQLSKEDVKEVLNAFINEN